MSTVCLVRAKGTHLISLSATTRDSFTRDSTLLTSRLSVNVSLDVDETRVSAQDLFHSNFPTIVKDWLSKHQTSLAIDRVDDPNLSRADQEKVIIPVVSFSRTSLSRALSTDPSLDPLKSLDLSFSLESATPASQEGNTSLLDQALSTPLPFFLVSLVSDALTLFAKKAVKSLPLAFNPISIDRLSNDLVSHASIAASLSNILLRQPTQVPSTQTAASLKLLQLKNLLRPLQVTPPSTPPTISEAEDAKTLVTALLLRGIKTHPPDAFLRASKLKRKSKATEVAEDELDAISDGDEPADATTSNAASSSNVAAVPEREGEQSDRLSGGEDEFEELSDGEDTSQETALAGGAGRALSGDEEDEELDGFEEEEKLPEEGDEMLWDGLDEEEDGSEDEELEMDQDGEGTRPHGESGDRVVEEDADDDLMHDLW